MTFFGALRIVGTAVGILLGIRLGGYIPAVWGPVLGAVLGGLIGERLGRVPLAMAMVQVSQELSKAETKDLERRLVEQYFIAHLILEELNRRGLDLAPYESVLVQLLRSESQDQRRFAWRSLQVWFPQRAKAMHGYDPLASPEDRKKYVGPKETPS